MTTGPAPGAPTRALTVVIATLGGESLGGTIDALNRGSLVPAEILVCIPALEAHRVRDFSDSNVRIVATDCRGQVPQRAVGFRNASHDLVMQLDDDIFVEERCLELLSKAVTALGPGVAVGPSLMALSTGESVYRRPERSRILPSVYDWLMNGAAGYAAGKIDKAGSLIGIDPKTADRELVDVECLAGGCIMHHRKNLVLDDFYPFKGKAYYEDVVHSHHLRSRGIDLKVHTGARCWLETADTTSLGPLEYLKYLATDSERRKYAMRLAGRASARMYLFYLVDYLSYLWKKARGSKTPRKVGAPR